MNGKSRFLAAITNGVEKDFPVAIPYIGIFLRDHWEEVTRQPWWVMEHIDLQARLKVEEELMRKLDLDWVQCGFCPPKDWREKNRIETYGDHVFMINTVNGEKREIKKPPIGGELIHINREPLIKSVNDADKYIQRISADEIIKSGRLDYARMVGEKFGSEKFICASIGSPYWTGLSSYFGFKGMMLFILRKPELVCHTLERVMERDIEILMAYSKVGIDGVWLEECLASSNEISPKIFKEIVLPYNIEIVSNMRKLGLKSIYYACGDVRDRLELMIEAKPDCIALEESKGKFKIDIEWVGEVAGGRTCVFGNLDAINVLQNSTREKLEKEVRRQVDVGRRYKRFVVSLGSPVTPKTSISRVKEYIEIARQASSLI